MSFMAAAAPYMMAASAGMSILGGVQQASAQRSAGDAAYANALQRAQAARQQAQIEARQLYENASTQQGAGQVQAQQERDRAAVLAGRAKAVMAASGAGVDPNLVASLIGQGNFNADTAMWNANEKARGMRNQAQMDIYNATYGANSDLYTGSVTRSNDYSAADNTIIGAVTKGALSFAQYYGGKFPGSQSTSNIDNEIASWSKYGQDDLSQASLEAALQRNAGYVA